MLCGYSRSRVKGWYRTRDFSFGAAVLEEQGLPDPLRKVLESWTEEEDWDGLAENVSSQGVKAWAVKHEMAVENKETLSNGLRDVVLEIATLEESSS